MTKHFIERQTSRNLRPEIFEFVLSYGQEFNRAGAIFVTVVEKDLPKGIGRRMVEAARGWVLVLSGEGVPITCYRNAKALKHIYRKPKFSRIGRYSSLEAA